MLERYDQSELLALIEGDLDARSAAALQARLAKDPAHLGADAVDGADRAELRTLEEPALPVDFIAAIQPMLTRPMLIEHATEVATVDPGEFRRKHRRQTHRVRWMRLAAAAAIALLVFGGSWAVYESVSGGFANTSDDMQASNDASPSSNGGATPNASARGSGPRATSPADALGSGVVHHGRPQPLGSMDSAALAAANSSKNESHPETGSNHATANAQPVILAAEFAVVVQVKDAKVAESSVSGVLADLGSRAALVRNFSYAEAQKLNEQYRIAHAGSSRNGDKTDPTVAAIAPGTGGLPDKFLTIEEMRVLAQHVREQMSSHVTAPKSPTSPPSETADSAAIVAGEKTLAPSLEQQLEFSSRGATYTIAVPASELISLVERLALNNSSAAGGTMLRMLPTSSTTEATSSNSSAAKSPTDATPSTFVWLTEGPLVRQAMQRLSQAPADAIVLLPVVVK